ncbi:glutaminyl-peptide cyclotransferase [Rhodococcus qingshengii]|nr:glutamine cyclotransferase [Rhodococcus erythropolis SK121]KSU82737.1 glutaminyl-peptide cyclotransferase [Rhodococcus qingshengii]
MRTFAVVAVIASALAGCSDSPGAPDNLTSETGSVEIVRVSAHDPDAFTQGLEIDGNRLYESTGRVGQSWVRSSEISDEQSPASGPEVARADLDPPLFGEGITVAGDTLWQLTWKDGVAIARDKDTLTERGRFPLDTEGWGICSLGDRLVSSDGSATLTFRDPETFASISTIDVTRSSESVGKLNELECSEDGSVYANVWTTDTVVRIDPSDGTVTNVYDASALREELVTDGSTSTVDVLNGIAQIPGTDRFLLTGKYWPQMFEVRFVN